LRRGGGQPIAVRDAWRHQPSDDLHHRPGGTVRYMKLRDARPDNGVLNDRKVLVKIIGGVASNGEPTRTCLIRYRPHPSPLQFGEGESSVARRG
jgi:hypothetical protein